MTLSQQLREAGEKATPGAWASDGTVSFSDRPDLPCVFDEHRMIVAQLWDDGHTDDECEANAALIVALHNSAPAMIARLRYLETENSRLREDLADSYVKLSGVSDHASDCATSSAPAITPGPCDCAVADSVRSRRINGLEVIRDVNPAIASVALLQETARAALGEPQ